MATETDKVSTGALGTLVTVGLFATASIMLAVTALVRYSAHNLADERASMSAQGYHDLKTGQVGKLSGKPTWTDKGQGKVSIPIERAKAKVLEELTKDPSAATPPAPAAPATSGETAQLAPAGAAVTTDAAEQKTAAKTAADEPKARAHAVATKQAAPAAAAPAAPAPAQPAAPAPKPTDG
jgi:hypothetical protein